MKKFIKFLLAVAAIFAAYETMKRIIKRTYPEPMPFSHKERLELSLSKITRTLNRIGVEDKDSILEIGAGTGVYTVWAAKRIKNTGKLFAIDLQKEMIAELNGRLEKHNISNVESRVEDCTRMSFKDGTFDLIYMIKTYGEIKDKKAAVREISRIIRPGGILSITEYLPDPHYYLKTEIKNIVEKHGFYLREEYGGIYEYTLNFKKI